MYFICAREGYLKYLRIAILPRSDQNMVPILMKDPSLKTQFNILTGVWFFTKSHICHFSWILSQKGKRTCRKNQRSEIVNKWHVFWRFWKITIVQQFMGNLFKNLRLIFNSQPLCLLRWHCVVTLQSEVIQLPLLQVAWLGRGWQY